MKYFAMIGGRQIGPLELTDLVKEGVRPDTYVWCKGMDDWAPAEDVADICRFFRQRLAGEMPEQSSLSAREEARMAAEQAEQEELLQQVPPFARDFVRKSGIKLTKDDFHPQPSFPKFLPLFLILLSVLMILVGFLLL